MLPAYKILGLDGKEYGPVSAEAVRLWIAQRRAQAATSAQADGDAHWQPLSSFPEFADALASNRLTPPALPPSGPARTSRLAIASVVCGLLGFLCLPALAGLVLGIGALVTISQSRGRRRGRGLAIGGLCASVLTPLALIPIGIFVARMMTTTDQVRDQAHRTNCADNLKHIYLAARQYSDTHQSVFPPDFQSMSNELGSPQSLVCPADPHHAGAASWAGFDPRRNLSYEFIQPGVAQTNILLPPQEVLFRCPYHNSAGMADGSLQQLPPTFGFRRPDRGR